LHRQQSETHISTANKHTQAQSVCQQWEKNKNSVFTHEYESHPLQSSCSKLNDQQHAGSTSLSSLCMTAFLRQTNVPKMNLIVNNDGKTKIVFHP